MAHVGFAAGKAWMKLPRRSSVELFWKADALLVDLGMALRPCIAARSVSLARPEVREVLPLLAALTAGGLSPRSAVECAAAPATPALLGSLAAPSTHVKSLLRADAEKFARSNKQKQLEGAEMLAPKRCLQHGCREVGLDGFRVALAASDVLVIGAAREGRVPSVTVDEVPGGGDCLGAPAR